MRLNVLLRSVNIQNDITLYFHGSSDYYYYLLRSFYIDEIYNAVFEVVEIIEMEYRLQS